MPRSESQRVFQALAAVLGDADLVPAARNLKPKCTKCTKCGMSGLGAGRGQHALRGAACEPGEAPLRVAFAFGRPAPAPGGYQGFAHLGTKGTEGTEGTEGTIRFTRQVGQQPSHINRCSSVPNLAPGEGLARATWNGTRLARIFSKVGKDSPSANDRDVCVALSLFGLGCQRVIH